MKFIVDDGGRSAAGFRGAAGDCACRAISIATQRSYKEVYDNINKIGKLERTGKRKKTKSSARNRVHKYTLHKYMDSIGWVWIPCMEIGKGCSVHLCEEELPGGRLVVSLSRHITAVIDGVIYDTYDPSRNGTRCVYGYFRARN